MENHEWIEVANAIRLLLDKYSDQLSRDTVDGVNHYLNHDEYEMAFEGLCIGLMNGPAFSAQDRQRCQAMAKRLGLDRDSVFDSEFWQKLTTPKV